MEGWYKTELNIYEYKGKIYSFKSKSHTSPNCCDTNYLYETLTLLENIEETIDYKEEYYNAKMQITELENTNKKLEGYMEIVKSFSNVDRENLNYLVNLLLESYKKEGTDKYKDKINSISLLKGKVEKLK